MSTKSEPSKIAIIGAAGTVGSTIAYSLVLNPIAGQIILSDPQQDVLKAQAEDLRDAILQSETASTRIVIAQEPKDAAQADIIIFTAGTAQKKGESRTDLVGKNVKILKSAMEALGKIKENAIVLIVANPVDVLTRFAQKFIDLPNEQVFGSGTWLDSARLKGKLAEQIGVGHNNVDAFVIGEHGETQVIAWSSICVGGVPLEKLSVSIDREQVAGSNKDKAGNIIESKGTTNYGIGAVAAAICKAILFDQKVIRPVSHWQDDLGVCLSRPAILGRRGLLKTIELPLSEEERKQLGQSAKSLKEINREAEKALQS